MPGNKRPDPQPPANLRELIHEICKRPVMFTGSFCFSEAAAYIEGYRYACEQFRPEALGSATGREFDRWLALKLNGPRNFAWSNNLNRAYPDDEVKFKMLPLLYEEFLNRGEWSDWDPYLKRRAD